MSRAKSKKYRFKRADFCSKVRERRLIVDADYQASKAGVARSTLLRIENRDINMKFSTFLKVCNWLGEHPGNFFY